MLLSRWSQFSPVAAVLVFKTPAAVSRILTFTLVFMSIPFVERTAVGLFSFNIDTELCFVDKKINTTCVDSTRSDFKTGWSRRLLRKMKSGLYLVAVRNVVLRGLWLDRGA